MVECKCMIRSLSYLEKCPLCTASPSLLTACEKLVKFADEILPQTGKLCFDIGNLNDALCEARPAIKQAKLQPQFAGGEPATKTHELVK